MLAVAVVGGTVGVGLKYFPMQCKIADVAFRQTYQILLKAELPSPKRSRSSRLKTLRPWHLCQQSCRESLSRTHQCLTSFRGREGLFGNSPQPSLSCWTVDSWQIWGDRPRVSLHAWGWLSSRRNLQPLLEFAIQWSMTSLWPIAMRPQHSLASHQQAIWSSTSRKIWPRSWASPASRVNRVWPIRLSPIASPSPSVEVCFWQATTRQRTSWRHALRPLAIQTSNDVGLVARLASPWQSISFYIYNIL